MIELSWRGVFFDLDGTLLDTNDLIVASFQHTARVHLGRELPVEEIYATFGETLVDTLSRWVEAERVPELLATYRAHNLREHDRRVSCFPGARDCLEALRARRVLVGVVTSKFRRTAERGLSVCGLSDLVDLVVGFEDTERHKPEPDPILTALERSGLPAGEVVMVGDSPGDVRAAVAAGVSALAVGWSVFPPERLLQHGAEAILARWDDLLGRLDVPDNNWPRDGIVDAACR